MMIKKSTKQTIIVAFVILIISIISFFVIFQIEKKQMENIYFEKTKEVQKELEEKTRIVYLPNKKIKPGEIISNTNVSKVVYISEMETSQFCTKEDFGKRTIIALKKDMPILKDYLTENTISESSREQEFSEIKLSLNLKTNDLVDIRIAYPNGESFVVLAQKMITVKEDNICYLRLDAEELDRVQSAICDAYVHKATIYTVKYVQLSLTESSIVNYIPSQEVIDLIKSDPNIFKTSSEFLSKKYRMELEQRLKKNEALKEKQAQETATNIDHEVTNNNSDVEQTKQEKQEDDLDE